MRRRIRLLVLTKYGRRGASTRYRSLQYFPALEDADFECTFSPLLTDQYLEARYLHSITQAGHLLLGAIRRLRVLLSAGRYDAAIVEKELLPFLPATLERLLRGSGIPYIVDYDDAIFHTYDQHRNPLIRLLLRKKIGVVMQNSRLVVAGNQYLAGYAERSGAERVEVLPTVVDLTRYPVAARRPGSGFTVGWIGSPSTTKYLATIAPALAEVCAAGAGRVVLIGAGEVRLPGVPLEIVSWSEDTEVEELGRFDVGIMPLVDQPWERGKCGFKLIQYMACGLPVVASPVGVNTEIVGRDCGFLASTPDEWTRALRQLQASPEQRWSMGAAGRDKVERFYSLQVTAPRFVSLVRSVAQSRDQRARAELGSEDRGVERKNAEF